MQFNFIGLSESEKIYNIYEYEEIDHRGYLDITSTVM